MCKRCEWEDEPHYSDALIEEAMEELQTGELEDAIELLESGWRPPVVQDVEPMTTPSVLSSF